DLAGDRGEEDAAGRWYGNAVEVWLEAAAAGVPLDAEAREAIEAWPPGTLSARGRGLRARPPPRGGGGAGAAPPPPPPRTRPPPPAARPPAGHDRGDGRREAEGARPRVGLGEPAVEDEPADHGREPRRHAPPPAVVRQRAQKPQPERRRIVASRERIAAQAPA